MNEQNVNENIDYDIHSMTQELPESHQPNQIKQFIRADRRPQSTNRKYSLSGSNQ
jgi:hypothetical protein